MIESASRETTFVVFRLDGVLVGVAAADVAEVGSLSSELPGIELSGAEVTTRMIRLHGRHGALPPRIRAPGVLQVLSLPMSQVVPLPRLCASTNGFAIAVALFEESVRFLIIDPYRLAQADAPAVSTAGAQELR